MKYSILSMAACAALILAGCSSEEPGNNKEFGEASGYLAVGVNLPTTLGSRAVTYTDGTAEEYAVENATLLIFEKAGSSELDFKFVESAELGGLSGWNKSTDEQITTSARGVACLSKNISVTGNVEYYGFVMLNNPKTGGYELPTAGTTYGSWLNGAQSPVAATGALYMANAPRYSANAMPLTLVAIDKSKIAASEASATESGAEFFVERGVAKVTVTDASLAQKDVASQIFTNDKVTLTHWALDVVNKQSYPAHNIDGLAASYADIWKNEGSSAPCTSRFVGGNNTFMRVFWGKDPNYDKDVTTEAQAAGAFNMLTSADLDASSNSGKSVYCLENTFDVNHMMQGQTSRVVFKANYAADEVNAGETFYRVGYETTLYSETDMKARVQGAAQSVVGAGATFTPGADITGKAGVHALTTDMFKGAAGGPITDAQLAAIVDKLAAQDGISTYLNGVCYYVARIKHFGDAETPWNLGDPTYAGNSLKYLGRYGVVRNNWYELNVGSITGPGYPELPTITDAMTTLSDDESDLHITVSVNILPWTKRVQEVDL